TSPSRVSVVTELMVVIEPLRRSIESTSAEAALEKGAIMRRAPQGRAAMDLIIRNGAIVDGTGAPKFRGDVGVKDGKVAAVGKVSAAAKRIIDAEGAIVTPGFVDIHTHYDGQVSWDAMLAPSSINGVTSTAMGNCGVGFAPAHVDKHDFL